MDRVLIVTRSITDGGATKRIKLISQILSEKGYTVEIISFDNVDSNDDPNTLILMFRFFICIWKKIRKNNYSILICNSRRLYPKCKIITLLLNIKYVNFVQIVYKNQPYFFKYFYSKNVLCVSNATKEYLTTRQNIPKKNIYVIKNSSPGLKKLNQEEINLVKNKFNIYDEFVISCIARFHEIKGHKYLIESYKEITKIYPSTKLLLMGYGDYKKNVEEYINQFNISDKVIFIESDHPVNEIMMISDFLVLPSLREGLPTMILEAFSLGKTVVASNIPGTNEIVKHNYNGLLFPPKNTELLTNCMIQLIEGKELKKRLELNSLKTYQSKFSFEKYKEEIVKYFDTL